MWVCWEEDKALCERASYQIVFVGVNCPWRCLLCPVHQGLTMSNTLLATVKDSRHCSIDLSCIALCFSELLSLMLVSCGMEKIISQALHA